MMLQLNDDGVFSAVNEENLIYVDENELDELIDRCNCLKEENEQLKQENLKLKQVVEKYIDIKWVKFMFGDIGDWK